MNVFELTELINQPLFIYPHYAAGYSEVIHAILNGEKLKKVDFSAERELRVPVYLSAGGGTVTGWQHNKAEKNSVAVMRIKGPILKDSQMCGPTGMSAYADQLNQMANNPNILGCVMRMESGGGAAYAVKPMADAMGSFPKPLIVLAEDIMASAAYYIASYADEIMADNPKSIIGSIGTKSSFQDLRPMLERKGVKFHEVFADQSTEKGTMNDQALKGDYTLLKQKILNPLNDQFIADVQANRPGIPQSGNKVFNGDVYLAQEAMGLGMIDSLGNLNDAVGRVRTLAQSKTFSKKSTQNKTDMKFPQLQLLAGKTEVSQELLTAVNAELAEAGITGFGVYAETVITDAAAVTLERDGLLTANQTLAGQLATVNTSLATMTTENGTLKQKLAKAPAAVAPVTAVTEQVVEKTQEQINQEAMDALPHNQALKNNPMFK